MKTIKSILSGCAALVMTASCSFLGVEPTDKITPDAIFASEGGIEAFLANLYSQLPIEDYAFAPAQGFLYNYGSVNNNGAYAWNKTDDCIGSQHQDAGGDSEYDWWTKGYQLNNNVNSFFGYIEDLKNASEETKNTLLGEAWFVRGHIYFALAKRYGGVPIIDKLGTATDSSSLYIPRSTEVETWDYVLECFDRASEYLGDGDGQARRANKWSALGYKARAALHAASVAKYWDQAPLSGPAVDQALVGGFTPQDVERYYTACSDACRQIIESEKFSLYQATPNTPEEASKNFAELFVKPNEALSECMFIRGYQQVGVNFGHNIDNWLNPAQTAGAWPHPGRSNPTLEFAENFEYYSNPGGSGKFVTYEGDAYDYLGWQASRKYREFDNPLDMFADKDARLSAVTILPNSTWKGKTIVIQGGLITTDGKLVNDVGTKIDTPYKDAEGNVFYPFGGNAQSLFSGFSLNGGNNTRTGFGFKKGLDPEYVAKGADWNQSTEDFIDLRYAEILLNYAEVYAESGIGDEQMATDCLNATRRRAGHMDRIAPTLQNVLRERRCELCLENARTWDLVRRREYHKIFSNYRRGSLTPIFDLRTHKYIFVREYCAKTNNVTVTTKRYYKSIPGIASNGLVQNPQW